MTCHERLKTTSSAVVGLMRSKTVGGHERVTRRWERVWLTASVIQLLNWSNVGTWKDCALLTLI